MSLIWLFFIGSISLAHANHDAACITFKQCRENPDVALTVFQKNKEILVKNYNQEIDFMLRAHQDAIQKLNKEILESPTTDCRHFQIKQDPSYISDLALKWCFNRAEECKDQYGSGRSKREIAEEDCLDDESKFCLNVTRQNYLCKDIDYRIHILEECGYLDLFADLYRDPWEACLDEFDLYRNRAGAQNRQCDWYIEAIGEHPGEIDDIIALQKEILKRLIDELQINIPFNLIDIILDRIKNDPKRGVLQIILNLAYKDLDIDDIIASIDPNQIKIIIEALKKYANITPDIDFNEQLRNLVINITKKLHLNLSPEEIEDLIRRLQIANVNWNSKWDIIAKIKTIFNLNISWDWQSQRARLWEIIKDSNLNINFEDLDHLLRKLRFYNFDWGSDQDILKYLKLVFDTNYNTKWTYDDLRNKIIEILFNWNIKLPNGVIDDLVNRLIKLDIDWDSTQDISAKLLQLLKINLNDWDRYREIVLNILQHLKINLSPEDLGNLLWQLSRFNIDWNSPVQVLLKIKDILKLDLNFDLLRIKLQQIIDKYNLPILPGDINNLILRFWNINWNSESDILLNLGNYLNLNLSDWVNQREILIDLLGRLNISLSPSRINDILLKLQFGNINFNVESDLIAALAKLLGMDLLGWFDQRQRLVDILAKLNLNLPSIEIDDLLRKLMTLNLDWKSDISLITGIGTILKLDLTRWLNLYGYRDRLLDIINRYKLKITNEQIDIILKEFAKANINWGSEYEIINNLKKIVERNPVSLVWTFEKQRSTVAQILAKYGFNLTNFELNNVMKNLIGANINWNSEIDIIDALRRMANINITIGANWNLDLQRQVLLKLFGNYGITLPSIRIEDILRRLNTAGVKWDSLQSIVDGLKSIANINIDLGSWSLERQKNRLLEILLKYKIDPKTIDFDGILTKLSSGNFNWDSEFDIVTYLKQIGININFTNWNFADYRDKLLEIIKKFKLNIPADQIDIILRQFTENQINWGSEYDIIKSLEQFTGSNINAALEMQRKVIIDLLAKFGITLSSPEINNIIKNLIGININWSNPIDVIDALKLYANIPITIGDKWTLELQLQRLAEIFNTFGFPLPTDLGAVLTKINIPGLNWDNRQDIIKALINAGFNIDFGNWTIQRQTERLIELFKQYNVNIPWPQIPDILLKLSTGTFNWNSEFDLITNLKDLANISINIGTNWTIPEYRNVLSDLIIKLNLNLPLDQVDKILADFKAANLSWGTDQDILNYLQKYIAANIQVQKDKIIDIIGKFNINFPSKQIDLILNHLNLPQIDWKSDEDILAKLKLFTEQFENKLKNILIKYNINLSENEFKTLAYKLGEINFNWDNENDIINILRMNLNFEVDWTPEKQRNKLLEILKNFQINIPKIELDKILQQFGNLNINWNSKDDIIAQLKLVANLDVTNPLNWSIPKQKEILNSIFFKFGFNYTPAQIDAFVKQLGEINFNWNSENDLITNIKNILKIDLTWNPAKKRETIIKLFADLQLNVPQNRFDDIFNKILNININWDSKDAIILALKQYANFDINDSTYWNLDKQRKVLIDLFAKYNLTYTPEQINEFLQKLSGTTITWNNENSIITILKQNLNIQVIWTLENQRSKLIEILTNHQINIPKNELDKILNTLITFKINWNNEDDIIANLKLHANFDINIPSNWHISHQKQILTALFVKYNLNFTPIQIDGFLKTLGAINLNWNNENELINALNVYLKINVHAVDPALIPERQKELLLKIFEKIDLNITAVDIQTTINRINDDRQKGSIYTLLTKLNESKISVSDYFKNIDWSKEQEYINNLKKFLSVRFNFGGGTQISLNLQTDLLKGIIEKFKINIPDSEFYNILKKLKQDNSLGFLYNIFTKLTNSNVNAVLNGLNLDDEYAILDNLRKYYPSIEINLGDIEDIARQRRILKGIILKYGLNIKDSELQTILNIIRSNKTNWSTENEAVRNLRKYISERKVEIPDPNVIPENDPDRVELQEIIRRNKMQVTPAEIERVLIKIKEDRKNGALKNFLSYLTLQSNNNLPS